MTHKYIFLKIPLLFCLRCQFNPQEIFGLREQKGKREIFLVLNDHTIELILPNAIGYERIAMGCLASFAQSVGFKQERIEDLKTAVAEACINAVQHGNKGHPDARVIVTMKFENGAFNIAVMDKGDGIPELPNDPNIEKIIDNQEPATGFGLFLIKKLVDQVEFNEMTNQGHVVRMVFQKKV